MPSLEITEPGCATSGFREYLRLGGQILNLWVPSCGVQMPILRVACCGFTDCGALKVNFGVSERVACILI